MSQYFHRSTAAHFPETDSPLRNVKARTPERHDYEDMKQSIQLITDNLSTLHSRIDHMNKSQSPTKPDTRLAAEN